MAAGEARGDMEDIVTLRRIARLVATYLSWIEQGCNPIPAYLRLSATGSLQHSSRCASFRHARSCQRYRWPSNMPRCGSTSGHGALYTDNLIGHSHMIEFPNHSRSYDRTRDAVRFWGHDSAIEASFFIDEGALRRIQPDARPDESGLLNAFDSNRDRICAAAAKVYVGGSRGSYDLIAANF
ncbi:DUF1488 domain-containing protein [Bradyrhizobium erythrophlei]|uniref:DUF1488 domain-containing protein n=1 Tax=Bradyrhizobium erythrophlei TaxID=1437360 RepID=UPI0035F0E3E4